VPSQTQLSVQISLSEVLGALSHALDLTEGQPLGHTIRTCLIGMRIADELSLPAEERSALYYALLLKDAGCSSNAARMAALFGSDDRHVKPRMKVVDWHDGFRLALATARNVGVGQSIFERVRHFIAIARTEGMTRDLIAVRCERGASIASQLGFPTATVEAVRSLDEHWCGLGYAKGLRGDEIPLLARIANLAQTLEAMHDTHGPGVALEVAKDRRGSWFDPKLVDIVSGWRNDVTWWRSLRAADAKDQLLAAEPPIRFASSTTTASTRSPSHSPTSSTRSRPTRTAIRHASPSTRDIWRSVLASTPTTSAGSSAPDCCTTSGSLACRIRFSTRTARPRPASGSRFASTPSTRCRFSHR